MVDHFMAKRQILVSEEKIFLTLANQKKELILATMFVGQMERNGETL
jgi:hypothetical protein